MNSTPKLRELRVQPGSHQGRSGVVLSDALGISQAALFVPTPLLPLLMLCDGTRDPGTIKTAFELRTGMPLSMDVITRLLSALDESLFLDNERFAGAYAEAIEQYRASPYRPYTLPGRCCPAQPDELSRYFRTYLDRTNHAGQFDPSLVRGLIVPHIDFPRGGPVYAEVWSRTAAALQQAELIIILGTDHAGGDHRITLTRQAYQTPWGVVPTAGEIVDTLAASAGDTVYRDELHHRGEHSIESALLWVHYLLGAHQCPVLPVLCGSFHESVEQGRSPALAGSVSTIAEALRQAASTRRTIFIAAADLAHVGPVFGDTQPLDAAAKSLLESQDSSLMRILELGDAEAFFNEVSSDKDRRRICGLSPIYLMLLAMSDTVGVATGYDQCPASQDGGSLVSICGMVYCSRQQA